MKKIKIPKSQVYFYTSDWQIDEVKASKDIKGKTTKTKNIKKLFKKLDT